MNNRGNEEANNNLYQYKHDNLTTQSGQEKPQIEAVYEQGVGDITARNYTNFR